MFKNYVACKFRRNPTGSVRLLNMIYIRLLKPTCLKYLITLLLFLMVVNSNSQSDCPCCTPAYQQFDFWVGDWSVFDTLGNSVGENLITKMENNCVIMEQWKGSKGFSGRSMNYFDKSDSTWNQLWLDCNGGILKLRGKFINGKMVLKGELLNSEKPDAYYNQITWIPNPDGTVTQIWELYDREDNPQTKVFHGIYRHKD